MFSNLFGRQSTQKLFDMGLNAYHKGNHKTAVDKLSDALKKETQKLETLLLNALERKAPKRYS